MNIEKKIRMAMASAEIKTDSELAGRVGWSRANFCDRLKRDSWKVADLEKIADAMNCDLRIEFIDRETGKEF